MKNYLILLAILIALLPFNVFAAINIKDPSTYPSFSRHLYYRKGNVFNGEDVKMVQLFLKDLGYNIDVDGNYGPLTQEAAQGFMTQYMDYVGTFGPNCWNKMVSMLKAKYPVRAKSISVISLPSKV